MPSSQRTKNKHSGAVQVRGMIRRIWRPRYLEIDHDGVLRYYEAVESASTTITSGKNTRKKKGDIRREMQAFSLPDLKNMNTEALKQPGQDQNQNNASNSQSEKTDDSLSGDKDDQDHVIVKPPSYTSLCEKVRTLSKDSRDSTDSQLGGWDINIPSTNETNENVEVTVTPPLSASGSASDILSQARQTLHIETGNNNMRAPAQKPVSHIQPEGQDQDGSGTTNNQAEKEAETLHHHIHEHRPKAVMTILSARLIDASSLRDVHVGLPKGTHGFVFCGRQMFSEHDAHTYGNTHGYGQEHGSTAGGTASSIMGDHDHFEIRDDICHPLSILNANDQYFDTSRDYLCSVATEEEAKRWVAALKWAANIVSSHGDKGLVAGSNIGTNVSPNRRKNLNICGNKKDILSSLDMNEISIRGSFEDAVKSPMGSPTGASRGINAFGSKDGTGGIDLTRSLLSDSSADLTDTVTPEGYTLVTKVKNFQVKQSGWKRIIGIKSDITFEIRSLLLSTSHVINRSIKREKTDDSAGDDYEFWIVEQRTVFRTFDETKELLELITRNSEAGNAIALVKTLSDMKKSKLGDIQKMMHFYKDLYKTVDSVDGALRGITSDSTLCDATLVKQFLGLSGSPSLLHKNGSKPWSEKLMVSVGETIDDFVKRWLLGGKKEMRGMERAKVSILLMVKNPLVEAALSAIVVLIMNYGLKLCWSQPSYITFRMDILLTFVGTAFFMGFQAGRQKVHQVENAHDLYKSSEKLSNKCSMHKRPTRPAVRRNESIIEDDSDSFERASISEDSMVLPSPLPMYSDEDRVSCWSRPDDKIFNVRGKTYLRDRIKLPSGPSPFECRGVDMWLTNNPERNISRLPCVLGGKLHEEDTFCVNFLLPFGNFVSYFSIKEDAMADNVADVWKKFKSGDQMYRDARLKLLPVVIDGPWIVKKAVGPGTAPALLSQSIPLQYYFTPGSSKRKAIYEVDVIITASRIAKGILNVVKSHTNRLTIALSFIIEATTEAELPETVLCSCQLHSLNLENCPHLPKYFLDESSVTEDSDES